MKNKKPQKKKNKINPELRKKGKVPQNKKEYNISNLSIEDKKQKSIIIENKVEN